MTSLCERLDQYVAERRHYGGNWASQARQARPFAIFADNAGEGIITTELFLRWKAGFGSAGQATWAVRLSAVRAFAAWMQGHEPRTQVPPRGLIPGRQVRPRPWIYTDLEISAIIAEAARLQCPTGLRGQTFATMFGLIAVAGMRIGETLALLDTDVDTDEGTVHIRHAKGGRSRVLPVTDCTAARLLAHRRCRNRILGHPVDAFFCGAGGRELHADTAQRNFAHIGQRTGLREKQEGGRKGRGPRIHDLRHTFATRTIIEWFRQGRDVDAEMYKLSAFLGHAGPNCSYWYIEAVPELLQLASDRAAMSMRMGGRS